jgi:hypothetical protein
MASKNDITGAWIVSKPNNEMFEKNFDLIFGKKDKSKLAEYELNKSTGEVQKVFDFDEHKITIEHPTKVDEK